MAGMATSSAQAGAPKKSVKILFFMPSFIVGGAEWHTVRLILEMRRKGYDCQLIVYGRRRTDIFDAHPGAIGAEVLNIKGMSSASGWVKVWKMFWRERPDLVVAVNQGPLLVAIVAKFLLATRARMVCIFHTTEMQSREKYQGDLLNWFAPFCDLMIYVSANQKAYWEARGVHACASKVINNGIDFVTGEEEEIAQVRLRLRERLGLAPDQLLFGIVASYRPEKNHAELVRALAVARRAGSRVKIISVGDGPTQPMVAELVAELGLAGDYLFLGEQKAALPFIAACDAGVLPSTAESLPLAGLEFLSSGAPMIVSSIKALSEIVTDGVNGLVYRLGDINSLADVILRMENPQTRTALAKSARESVRKFSMEKMVDAYCQEFEAIMSRRASARANPPVCEAKQ